MGANTRLKTSFKKPIAFLSVIAVAISLVSDHVHASAELCEVFAPNPFDLKPSTKPAADNEFDVTEALKVCGEAARFEPDNPRVLFQLGMVFFQNGEVTKSIPWFEKAARLNHPIAQLRAGELFYCVAEKCSDYREALGFFERASRNGERLADYYLGAMYISGQGVRPDLPKAVQLFSSAAEAGFPEAKFALARHYTRRH